VFHRGLRQKRSLASPRDDGAPLIIVTLPPGCDRFNNMLHQRRDVLKALMSEA
jgi:hypothetical protein